MTKEAVFGVQARMVRLTPEASSNTLVRGGVFLMPQVDGGNNEIQGLGHQAAPKNGDIHAARSELKLNVLQTPDEIIANLPFATPREPLSQKIVDIYKAAVEVTPVERWKQEHYEKALAGVNEVAIEAQGGLTAEPKEAAMGVAGDILLRADRSGQDVFAIYKNATKSLVEKHKLPIPSDEEMLTALTVQIAALATSGRITEEESRAMLARLRPDYGNKQVSDGSTVSKQDGKTFIDRAKIGKIVEEEGVEGFKKFLTEQGIEEKPEAEGRVEQYAVALDAAGNLITDRYFGPATGNRLLDRIRTNIINALNGRDTELEADTKREDPPTLTTSFFRATGPGTFDQLWNDVETNRNDLMNVVAARATTTLVWGMPVIVPLTDAQVEEVEGRLATVNKYMDVLHRTQMEAAQTEAIRRAGGIRFTRSSDIIAEQLTAILDRTQVAETLQKSGEDFDTSDDGPLRYLLREIEDININLDDASFKQVVDTFAKRRIGSDPGQISQEAKIFLIEYLSERFLRKMDHLPDENWEMPVGLYVGGNYDYLELVAEHEFGKEAPETRYIIRLKSYRQKMHELYRMIPNQDQYKQFILEAIGDQGLEFVHNRVAGVADAFGLFEEIGLNISAMVSHRHHRILNDEEFQTIGVQVKDRLEKLQKEGLLRTSSGRRLTEWEAERAFVVGRAIAGGLQRTGIVMGFGGSPAHSTQIYRPAAQAGIQKALFILKFSETGLMGHGPARAVVGGAFKLADKFKEAAFKKGGALRDRFVDGVCGVSKRVAWLNMLGAPDILTNPSRSGAMALADIWIQREVRPGVWEQTTLLNVLHEIGEEHKQRYLTIHGKPAPVDSATGFIVNTNVAEYIRPDSPLAHGRFEVFWKEAVKQRLYLSYLAQYDAMPTDVKKLLYEKIAILKPQDMVSFYPELLDHAMRETGTNEAVWESLHEKLILQGRKRIVTEGRDMMEYNQTLQTIHTEYRGDEVAAHNAYVAAIRALPAGLTHHERVARLKDIQAKLKMNFHVLNRWQRKINADLVEADTARRGGAYTNAYKFQLLNDPEYLGGKLNAQERVLAEKIINISLNGTHAHGERIEPVAKTLSEAKIAYKICLDDMPHVAWAATGEGGGGLGRGSILTMYQDQAAVKQGVDERLAKLLLKPAEHADENIAGAVQLFSVHYGLPDAQDMIYPFILQFGMMLKENVAARHFGKWLRDMTRRPNSEMEKLYKASGLSKDEKGVRDVFVKSANGDAIADEKHTIVDRWQEMQATWRAHKYDNGITSGEAFRDLFRGTQRAKDFRNELWGKLTEIKTSKLEQALHDVGADLSGQLRRYRRKLFQILFGWIFISLKELIPEDIRKPAGI